MRDKYVEIAAVLMFHRGACQKKIHHQIGPTFGMGALTSMRALTILREAFST
jgi:hypothetical protein